MSFFGNLFVRVTHKSVWIAYCMEWYEISQFADKIEIVENYFVSLAANEADIEIFGFRAALQLQGAEESMKALSTFHEDFSSFRQEVEQLGRRFSQELAQLDGQSRLTEQVALVFLKLRMAQVAKPRKSFSEVLFNALHMGINAADNKKSLLGENQVCLDVVIVNLEKLRSLARRASVLLRAKEESNDEIFKPSNVSSDKVVELIESALAQIQSSTSLAPEEVIRLEAYLEAARIEAQSDKPSWSKILGALVIVAAVTSGLADAPGAANTVRETIEYILGASVVKPMQRFLPAPENFDAETALSR